MGLTNVWKYGTRWPLKKVFYYWHEIWLDETKSRENSALLAHTGFTSRKKNNEGSIFE